MTTTKRLRALNTPRPITIQADAARRPVTVALGRLRLAVAACHETWRIDDEWWRPQPVSRIYWRLSLEDGRVVDVYRDLDTGAWWNQAYG